MKAKSSSGSLPDYSAYRGVYIEDVDGYLYTESEWDGSKTPNGIAVLTDNCRFVMALADAYSDSCEWGINSTTVNNITTTTSESTAQGDYDGEAQTTTILNQLGASGAPAANYCRSYTFPNGATGYLGAAGEWQAALDNKAAITSALSKCGGTAMSYYYWTSTQYSSDDSWYMHWNFDFLYYSTKDTAGCFVRAFTSLKSDEQESGGGKIVNRVVITYSESGPDEYSINAELDYGAMSIILITVGVRKAEIQIGETSIGLNMAPLPTYDNTSISPTEDDAYIYQLVIE